MSYFYIQVTMAAAVILQVSQQGILKTETITTDIGKNITFNCTIVLPPALLISGSWITWYGPRTYWGLIAYNDTVLDQDKYSLHGISSILSSNYISTQSLTVHKIDEDDQGVYSCHFPYYRGSNLDHSHLIIRNFIPSIICSSYIYSNNQGPQISLNCEANQPSDPIIYLTLMDKEGKLVAQDSPSRSSDVASVNYNIPFVSISEYQWFTCVARIVGYAETRECRILNYTTTATMQTSNRMPVTEAVTAKSFYESGNSYHTSLPSYSKNINTAEDVHLDSETPKKEIISVTVIISAIAMISILMNLALLYMYMRKNKQVRDTEVSMEPYYATGIHQQSGGSPEQPPNTLSQDNNGYMEPINIPG